jgi:hypothetical protein
VSRQNVFPEFPYRIDLRISAMARHSGGELAIYPWLREQFGEGCYVANFRYHQVLGTLEHADILRVVYVADSDTLILFFRDEQQAILTKLRWS